MGRYSIGVDIGGTFTDCVVREEESLLVLEKAFTTPGAIGEGVVQCLKNAAGRLGVRLSDLLKQTEVFKIGTTSPVNRLINRADAKTAVITTKDHEDAIIIGRVSQKKPTGCLRQSEQIPACGKRRIFSFRAGLSEGSMSVSIVSAQSFAR